MKHALAILLLSCVLVAQDKPISDDPGEILRRAALGLESPAPSGKPAAAAPKSAEAPKAASVEKAAESKIRYRSINVRDELIVEISELKLQIATCRGRLQSNRSYLGAQAMGTAASSSYFEQARVQHESDITLLVESQRALILALAELAKEAAKDKPTEVQHSSPFPPKR
jgi:hypothetical protein